MNNKNAFIILTVVLYGITLWGFAIREQMAPGIHYFYPVAFLILFTMHCIVAYRLMKRSRFINGFQPLSILVFIVMNVCLLVSVSTLKREKEIGNYFAKNEVALNRMANHFMSAGDDNYIKEMKQSMKIERLWCKEDIFAVRLYTCLGYGYGVVYSERPQIERPDKIGVMPVTNWMRLKDHWFYYAIFD